MLAPRSGRRWTAVLAVVLLGASGLGIGVFVPLSHADLGLPPNSARPAAGPPATGPVGLGSAPSVHAPTSTAGVAGLPLPRTEVFFPNPHPGTIDPATGVVSPAFRTVPAPMGVSDLGVGSGGTAYAYRTTSFEGSTTIRTFVPLQPGYVASAPFEAPDWALLQLNAVAVNISYAPAALPGVFWLQSAVHLNGTTLEFEDNVWNFTAANASVSPTILFGNGHSYLHFYAGFGTARAIAYPLTVTLFDNVSRVGTHDVVHFNYTLTSGISPPVSGTYDTVTFNGTASLATPPQLEVNGSSLAPSGQLFDAELVLGGNGGGANTNFVALNATAALRFWNRTALAFQAVRSAYDFGSDSAETALGVAVHYAGSGGTAYLGSGPSLLYGLWNTSTGPLGPAASPGLLTVRLTTSPDYAFVFANLTAGSGGYSFAPSSASGVMTAELPPALNGTPYAFDVLADGYASATTTVLNTSDANQTITLAGLSTSLTTPVYLASNAQASAFGNASIPQTRFVGGTLYLNATRVRLAAPFLQLNDLANPTFQLFVEQRLGVNVAINGFVQDPSTFNYTFYAAPTRFYPGWTQGYFFFGGAGAFSVEHVSLQAQPALLSDPIPTFPAPTVEFFLVHGAEASTLAVSNDATGITAYGAPDLSVGALAVTTGGIGVVASNLSRLTVAGASAVGQGTVGIQLSHVTVAHLSGLSASGFATAVAGGNSSGLNVVGLTVGLAANGFTLRATNVSNVSWMNLSGGVTTTAGNWSYSAELNFSYLSFAGTGLDLLNDTLVSVLNATATGFGSSLVQDFTNSSQGTFTTIYAGAGAIGLNVSDAGHLTIRGLTAEIDSTGAMINDSSNVSAVGVLSSVLSSGIVWTNGSFGSFDFVNTSSQSVGVWIGFSLHVTVQDVSATNLTASPLRYFVDPLTLLYVPIAGVALFNDTYVNVTTVLAVDYGYAVWSNGTRGLTVANVEGWYDVVLVDLNSTTPVGTIVSKVQQVFGFGCAYGVFLENSTYVSVTLSTLEASTILGLEIQNGSHDSVQHNNFVANNRSSVSGSYSSQHVQAWTNNTTVPSFSGNFWADWGGAGSYAVNNTRDLSPQGAFYGAFLEFTESGVPTGLAWQLGLGMFTVFNTTASAIYLPGWILPVSTLAFAVLGPLDPAPHPRFGNVTWDGATLAPTHIQFGTPAQPFLILGLPAWAFVALLVVVGIVALALLLSRRQRRRPPVVAETFDAELPGQ